MNDGAADASGTLTCRGCGIKLRPRTPPASAAPAPPPPPAPPPFPAEPPAAPPAGEPLSVDALWRELREIRVLQAEILTLVRERGPAPAGGDPWSGGADDDEKPAAAPVRTRRKKSVLLVDDDPATRAAAQGALQAAEVPVAVADEGNRALAAIAADKPDVIVMELDMKGAMAGKDVINMIKATMEWVDIPIVLYTRLPIASQKDARTIHGADEFVTKDQGPAALVARVIQVFRRA
jgi:CheY-like chemotaxis protein